MFYVVSQTVPMLLVLYSDSPIKITFAIWDSQGYRLPYAAALTPAPQPRFGPSGLTPALRP